MVAESFAHLGCSSSDRFGDMDLSVSPRRGRRMRGLSFEDLESVGARHTRVFPLDSFEDGFWIAFNMQVHRILHVISYQNMYILITRIPPGQVRNIVDWIYILK